ncbi:hypothetical protein ACCE111639_01525 [Acinetobacter celticus]
MNSPMLMNWNQHTRELLPGFVVSLLLSQQQVSYRSITALQ